MNHGKILLGFDVGGTKCAAVAGFEQKNGLIEITDKVRFETRNCPSPREAVERFSVEVEKILAKHSLKPEDAEGIGISCGGPLDSRSGIILCPPNLPGWVNVPIVKILENRFHIPVRLQNDANACAVAEWRCGAGRGTKNMIFLTFGTGFGGGLILDGRLYSGTTDMAGECGHIRLAPSGPVGFGKAGSAEGFCSGGGIAQLARSAILKKMESGENVPWASDPEIVTAKDVAEAADSGDEFAKSIYAESGRRLGEILAILIDLLNPEKIVIGSIFARSEKLFRDEMQKILEKECISYSLNACEVVPAGLGEAIGDIASLVLASGKY